MACNIFLESRTEHRWLKWIALEDIGRYEDKTIRSSKSDPWRAAIPELFAQDAVPAQAARRWWTSKRRKPSRSDAPAGIKMSESSCLRHQSHDVPVGFSLSCKFRASLWSCNRDGCFYLSASRLFPKAQCGNCHFNLRCKCGMVWSGLHALDQFNFQLIPCDTWSFFMQFFGVLCVHSSVWGHAGSTVMSRHSYTVGCEMPPTRAAFPARCVQEDYRDVRCVISRIVQVQVELESFTTRSTSMPMTHEKFWWDYGDMGYQHLNLLERSSAFSSWTRTSGARQSHCANLCFQKLEFVRGVRGDLLKSHLKATGNVGLACACNPCCTWEPSAPASDCKLQSCNWWPGRHHAIPKVVTCCRGPWRL